ncbi:MFS transporter [Aquabacter sp. CN5-332]|uniref:MFS transporter n=1 Tax=Aquabacter sp. CN5-332 TaxID=3156608 RepID=UPI0032B5CB50
MTKVASWMPLVALWTCGANLRLTILAVPPVISIIQAELGLSGTEVRLLSAIPVIMFAIAATPGSSLVSRFGVKRALLTGLVITAAGAASRAASSNIWLLCATSLVMSSGVALMQPTMAAAVRAWVPARAAFGTAVYTNGLIVGEVLPVAIMLPLLLPALGDWRLALGIWAIPVAAAAVFVATLPSTWDPAAAAPEPIRWLPELNGQLKWRVGLILGSVSSTYFCTNAFLPALLNGNGHPELISAALTALNLGQFPTSFLLLFVADRVQGKRWPYLLLGLLLIVGLAGLVCFGASWSVFWAAILGATCGAALALALALAPLLCGNPDEVARVSAAAFAISYSFAMLVSFASGVAWDVTGNVNAAFAPILLATVPILALPPTLFAWRR